MKYELWDVETANAQGVYATMLEALQVVRGALERDGRHTLKGLALVEVAPGGERKMIAQEEALIPLVGEPLAR